jgi:hypothetical protein
MNVRQTDGDINVAAFVEDATRDEDDAEEEEEVEESEEEARRSPSPAKNFLAFTTIEAGAMFTSSGTLSVSTYVPFVLSPLPPPCSYSSPRK